jgi:uridine phosphorylase
MAIAVEELARIGADTFIRVGSCGSLTPALNCGDLAISNAAVRMEGTSKQYVDAGYPAAASHDVTLALIEAAEMLGKKYEVGYTASTDSFYLGQGRPGLGNYTTPDSVDVIRRLQSQKVLSVEMEASALFTLTGLYGLRAGCVCAVYANRPKDVFEPKGEEDACRVAVEAARTLIRWDRIRRKAGRAYWFPSLMKADSKP